MNGGTGPGDDSADVLLVSANPRDARIVSCGLGREDVSLDVAEDVRTAIDRLTSASEDGTASGLPSLVVLDLATTPEEARTVLNAVTASPRLRTLPTVALVDHTAPVDEAQCRVRNAYGQGANGHVPKSDDVEAFADAIQRMAAFWFDRVCLPPELLYADSTSIQYD
jgi:CheY-like chemotaxis protein